MREIEDQQLRLRSTVELAVAYRPKRAHTKAEILISKCGERPKNHAVELKPGECRPVGEPKALQPGTAIYDFGGLDLGWYLLEAKIDDERVVGLGSWLTTFLTPESPERIELPPQRLEELHIYGHILEAGEPVAGEVRVETLQPGGAPMRRYPTDEDLLYHLYYFGYDPLPFVVAQLPEELHDRPLTELRGLGFGNELRACSASGSCRLFHHRSTFIGEGRFDIELSFERELLVKVLDVREAEPVEGALVVLGNKQKRLSDTLQFIDGEVFLNAGSTGEAISATSDAHGEIRVRQLDAGELRVVVEAQGFRRFEGEVDMPLKGEKELQIELEPEAPRGLFTLRLSQGRPAASAALVALTAEGDPDYLCSKASDSFGEVELPPECLEVAGRRFVVLHPQALIQLVTAAQLRRVTELELEEFRDLPVRVRLLDPAGAPLVREAIALRFADFTLTPNHFLAASGAGGVLWPFQTDDHGEIALAGVDPRHGMPELARFDGGSWTYFPAAVPGEVVNLVLEKGQDGR
ncbi:MAG: carboxypeptidase regulatory-like domain-containing protein [Thermoanaerobaculia bacterium]|nr:carboxypeptidase regulatory-like domain-containing protein [Thermoanaerobaculia bacterium]